MAKRFFIVMLVLFTLTGASCLTKKTGKTAMSVQPGGSGMIYGHVSADQAVTGVLLRRHDDIAGRLKIGSKTFVYPTGHFTIINVPPGQYILAGYRSNRLIYPPYGSDEEPSGDVIRVAAKKITYAGSYRIVAGTAEESGPKRYRVQKKSQPGEKSILEFLKSRTDASGWSKQIDSRINKLH